MGGPALSGAGLTTTCTLPGMTTAFVHSETMQTYNPSDDVERPLRRRLGLELIEAYGMLDVPDVVRPEPAPASDEDILGLHQPAYVAAIQRYSANPALAADWGSAQWGVQPGGDTPARAGMHESAAAVCGAALLAADLVASGTVTRAFSPAPAGLHHAHAGRAAGFCVYNDCALAVRRLQAGGAERVAYIDVDGHHGDGVQWLFYEDPTVLTASVHEDGRHLYPGTGSLAERGVGAGAGTAINIPLPPFASDVPYHRAIDEVIAPAVRRFRPDVLVCHLGADPHHADPYTHLQVSLEGLVTAYRTLRDLAAELCGGRWIILSGGGYNIDMLARAWTLQLAVMLDQEPADELPPDWLALARERMGREDVTQTLRANGEPTIDVAQRTAADAEAAQVIEQAKQLFGTRA